MVDGSAHGFTTEDVDVHAVQDETSEAKAEHEYSTGGELEHAQVSRSV